MDETGMQNPIFKIATNMQSGMSQSNNYQNQMQQGGMNQMGMGQMNQNNQIDPNMINQNSFNMNNNPMMNQMNSGMNPMLAAMMQNNMMSMMQFNNQNGPMNQQAEMVNNINNMLNNNINTQNQQNQQNDGGMNVNFRTSGEGKEKKIMVQCIPEEKVSEIIQRYRAKADDRDPTKKFIFNAKALNKNLKVAEAGLNDGANIFVVNTEGVKGA